VLATCDSSRTAGGPPAMCRDGTEHRSVSGNPTGRVGPPPALKAGWAPVRAERRPP